MSLCLEYELDMASNPYPGIFGTASYSEVFDPNSATGRGGFPFHELELLPMHYSAPASTQAARPAPQPTAQPELPQPAMQPGDRAFLGGWDGDGSDTVAIRRGNAIHYENDLSSGNADLVEVVGRPDDAVTVADPRGNEHERVVLTH